MTLERQERTREQFMAETLDRVHRVEQLVLEPHGDAARCKPATAAPRVAFDVAGVAGADGGTSGAAGGPSGAGEGVADAEGDAAERWRAAAARVAIWSSPRSDGSRPAGAGSR